MKKIFEPVALGNLNLKNRIVRSATMELGAAEQGVIQPLLMDVHTALAEGNVGLIITGMFGVGPSSCTNDTMARIDNPAFVAKFSEIVRRVHAPGAKIVVQLTHCGIKAAVIDAGSHLMSPSDSDAAKGMTESEIQAVIADFGASAARCKEAGADGVQIHSAHGYLLSQFLSPYYNKRTDEYGGSIENRARLLFAVYDEVRRNVGPDYPVLVKLNFTDLIEPGLTGDECVWVCKELEARGINAIEISSGISLGRATSSAQPVPNEAGEGYFAEGALRVSSEVRVPVICVGGHRSPAAIESLLNRGNIAAISLCRPLICEPGLVARWANGDTARAKCISCNKCFTGKTHGCMVFPN